MKKPSFILFFVVFSISFSQTNANRVGSKLQSSKERTLIKNLLIQCANYRFINPDSSRYFGFEAVRVCKASKSTDLEAEAYQNIQATYEAQGDYKLALNYAVKALTIRKKSGDLIQIANSLNNIGIIYDDLGNFSLALNHYLQAYEIFKKRNNKEKLAMVICNLGVLFKSHDDYTKSILYYQEAYSLYKELKKPLEAAYCESNLGSVYYFTNQFKLSLLYSLKAEATFRKKHAPQLTPFPQANAGIAYRALGDLKKSLKYLSDALATHKRFNNKKEISFCYIQLAKVEMLRNNNKKAIEYLNQAVAVAIEIDAKPQIMDANKLLAEVYEAEKAYGYAYTAFKTYSVLKDSVFKKDKIRLITDFQTKYETEKKELQIKSLNQQSTIQNLKIKQRNILLSIALIVIVCIAGLSYLIYTRRKLKAEARLQSEINKHQEEAARAVLKAEEHERRRIATDLHDGIGQLLSVALMNMNSLYDKLKVGKIELSLADKSVALINESYDEMRTISHQMIPTALLKTGLNTAISEFLNKIDENKIKISWETIGLDERLEEQTETLIYRVIQEAVNNVIKHANATRLDIQLIKDADGISLTVEDNGKGFDKEKPTHKRGIGLKNIVDRIELLKGSVDFDSSPGKGTLLAIHIPANQV
ncbi:MAG: sensor histidine kinase [Pyrinomonadaceae bacterium]|nr:sensor histidine kinase [Sphingobacteriaceae bacterium]